MEFTARLFDLFDRASTVTVDGYIVDSFKDMREGVVEAILEHDNGGDYYFEDAEVEVESGVTTAEYFFYSRDGVKNSYDVTLTFSVSRPIEEKDMIDG